MRIVILEPLGVPAEKIEEFAAKLEAAGHDVVVHASRSEEPAEVVKRASGAAVLVLVNQPLKGEIIRSLPGLKMIAVAFTGIDHLDAAACRDAGITVCNAAGYSTDSVAELAFGLMLSVLRNMVPCDSAARKGGTRYGLIGGELKGRTLGIVGTGAIGIRVAEIGRAFGCNLLATSRTRKLLPASLGMEYVSLEELLSRSDIVSLHTPLTPQTKGMMDRARLALMKPGSILINTARGPLVDSQALADELNSGRIAGAGIDVFETEPPLDPAHPLLQSQNTVVAPHVAFATREALGRRAQITFDNIAAWLNGTPHNVVV